MSARLYAQLQPDEASLQHLINIQSRVPQRGRRVSPARLHMTLIHFGIIDEIIKQLPCNEDVARLAVTEYIAGTKHILKDYPVRSFTLLPIRYELFGEYGHTLVTRYASTPALETLHSKLLTELKHFFKTSGIRNVDEFMRNDPNFMHALTVVPHITIMKGYDGKLPVADDLRAINLTIMPFEYEQ